MKSATRQYPAGTKASFIGGRVNKASISVLRRYSVQYSGTFLVSVSLLVFLSIFRNWWEATLKLQSSYINPITETNMDLCWSSLAWSVKGATWCMTFLPGMEHWNLRLFIAINSSLWSPWNFHSPDRLNKFYTPILTLFFVQNRWSGYTVNWLRRQMTRPVLPMPRLELSRFSKTSEKGGQYTWKKSKAKTQRQWWCYRQLLSALSPSSEFLAVGGWNQQFLKAAGDLRLLQLLLDSWLSCRDH